MNIIGFDEKETKLFFDNEKSNINQFNQLEQFEQSSTHEEVFEEDAETVESIENSKEELNRNINYEKMTYIKIPKEICYSDNDIDGENKEYKKFSVITYILCNIGKTRELTFTLSDLCKWCGLKPITGITGSFSKLINQINIFAKKGYLELITPTPSIYSKYALIKVRLNINILDPFNNFGIISLDEIYRIKDAVLTDYKKQHISFEESLVILSYIRANINKRFKEPRVCWRMIKTIANDVGINKRRIRTVLNMLVELDMIIYQDMGTKKYNKNGDELFATMPKIFADKVKYKYDNKHRLILDTSYDPVKEIEKQKRILNYERFNSTEFEY